MAGPGNQLASLISGLSALRLVIVRCLNASNVAFRRSDHHWQNFEGWFFYQRRNWAPLTSWNSHGVCAISLGLHSYLRNGGRSRVEIKVEFHEGVVPLSTLLALYWYNFGVSHWSVWCGSYLPMLNYIYRSNGGHSQGDWVSEGILLSRKFVKFTRPTL